MVEEKLTRYGAYAIALGLLLLGLFSMGCTPQVGDSCVLSTDCGTTGNLVCDTSAFEGYCTQVDCVPGQCPNNAACILFNPSVPGCGYDDRQAGSRIGEQFCMATCSSNSDCRVGYVCANPIEAPWFADNLDAQQTQQVCIPVPVTGTVGGDSGPMEDPDAQVCQLIGPTFDAFPPPPDVQTDAAGN
jgi:hypothetical protein